MEALRETQVDIELIEGQRITRVTTFDPATGIRRESGVRVSTAYPLELELVDIGHETVLTERAAKNHR